MMHMIGGALFALITAACVGLSSFLSGYLSRRVPVLLVTGVAGAVAGLLLGLYLWRSGIMHLNPATVRSGVIYGIAELVGTSLYTYALSRGNVGVISGVGTVVVLPPVIYAFASGMAPSTVATIGIVILMVGVVALGWPQSGATPTPRSAIITCIVGVLISGLGEVSLSMGAAMDPAVATFFGYSIAPVAIVIGLVAGMSARRRRVPLVGEDVLAEREQLTPRQSRWALIAGFVGIGVLLLLGDLFYAVSLSMTNIGVASALSALDPLVVAPLGFVLLKERMTRVQVAGLGVALLGSVLALAG